MREGRPPWKKRFRVAALILGGARVFADAPAAATTRGFAIDRFAPAERGSSWFVNDSLDFSGTLRVALGVEVDWAYRPLVLRNPDRTERLVVTDQVFMHTGANLLVGQRFRFGVDIPVAIFQHGEPSVAAGDDVRDPNKAAFADVRLGGDARLVGQLGDPFTAAAGLSLWLPTGSTMLYTGDGTLRVEPHAMLAGEASGFVYAARVGFAFRPRDDEFAGTQLGSEVLVATALGVKAGRRLVFGPEFYASSVVTGRDAWRAHNVNAEWLLGGHISISGDWRAGAAMGSGFTSGFGTPAFRVIGTLGFSP